MRIKAGVVAVAVISVVALSACGGPKPVIPTPTNGAAQDTTPDTSGIKITGDAKLAANKLATEAIADLQQYWIAEYPKLYGQDYKPVSGGFFGMTPDVEGASQCGSTYADVEEGH